MQAQVSSHPLHCTVLLVCCIAEDLAPVFQPAVFACCGISRHTVKMMRDTRLCQVGSACDGSLSKPGIWHYLLHTQQASNVSYMQVLPHQRLMHSATVQPPYFRPHVQPDVSQNTLCTASKLASLLQAWTMQAQWLNYRLCTRFRAWEASR